MLLFPWVYVKQKTRDAAIYEREVKKEKRDVELCPSCFRGKKRYGPIYVDGLESGKGDEALYFCRLKHRK